LRELRRFLDDNGLRDGDALLAWLDGDDERHGLVARLLRLTEVNRVALDLLGVDNLAQAWRCLVGDHPLQRTGNRFRFIGALLEDRPLLELDAHLLNGKGVERHLWMVRSEERRVGKECRSKRSR